MLHIGKHQVDPSVRFDKAFPEAFVVCKQVIAFHLGSGLALSGRLGNQGTRFLQHVDKFAHVVGRGNGSVAGDNFGIGWDEREYFFDAGDHAAEAAAIVDVDKGKAVSDEVVAHVDDVGLWEKDDAIAISMSVREMNGTNVFAVEMDGGPVVEGNYGQSFFRCWSNGIAPHRSSCLQAFADVFVGNDRGLLAELGVAPGMVTVKMRVDDEPEGLFGDFLQSRFNLRSQRSKLVVNDHDAILADRNTNIPAGAFEHVDIAGDFGGFDLDVAEVLLGGSRELGAKQS